MDLGKESKKEIDKIIKIAHTPIGVMKALFVVEGFGNYSVKALRDQYYSASSIQEEADLLNAIVDYSAKKSNKDWYRLWITN